VNISHLNSLGAPDFATDFDPFSNLSGLESLTTLTSTIVISENESLNNIDALNGVISSGGLNVSSNPNISSLAAFANLQSMGGFYIADNSQLTTLGLTSLATVDGMFHVTDNPILCNQGAVDLLNQVEERQGYKIPNQELEISNNMDCTIQ
jgi:hypothetical protein